VFCVIPQDRNVEQAHVIFNCVKMMPIRFENAE